MMSSFIIIYYMTMGIADNILLSSPSLCRLLWSRRCTQRVCFATFNDNVVIIKSCRIDRQEWQSLTIPCWCWSKRLVRSQTDTFCSVIRTNGQAHSGNAFVYKRVVCTELHREYISADVASTLDASSCHLYVMRVKSQNLWPFLRAHALFA